MTIYGVSQSSGVERRLTVETAGGGVVLAIIDHAGGVERESITVLPDGLMSTLTDPVPGGSTLEGAAPTGGARRLLDVEIRRNEVLLRARGEVGDGWDVAVGLDDFQDALEKAVG